MITNKKQIGVEPYIDPTAKLNNVTFGEYCEVGMMNFIDNTYFGDYSYTGQFCFIQNTQLGKFVNIAANVRIGPTDHPYKRASLHHFTYRPEMFGMAEEQEAPFFEHRESRTTYIGHDTWIGHGVIIMPEVKVGNGAIIGSGAIVTKDVPPYAIAVGVPAKVVKYRFEEDEIKSLEAIKWWDWDYEAIKDRLEDFRAPISEFISKYYQEEEGAND